MREIKFRAWDRGEKLMGNVNWLCPRDREVFIVRGWFGDEDKELIGSQFELMQYTGLKDKNGKEIYEGDIVRTVVGQNTRIQIVKYDRFAYFITDNYIKEFLDATGQAHEVIGNLFENPELLTNPLIEESAS